MKMKMSYTLCKNGRKDSNATLSIFRAPEWKKKQMWFQQRQFPNSLVLTVLLDYQWPAILQLYNENNHVEQEKTRNVRVEEKRANSECKGAKLSA